MRTKSIFLAAAFAAFALPLTADVQFHKNSVKYRDSSKPNATGRSGSAAIEARALVNRDGSADLEITTGAFDPASSAGNIDKVQLKSKSTGTINDNRLVNDGTYSVHLPSSGRGEVIDIQANVSGIDRNRVDVVAVSETAKLRPDLRAGSINAPQTAIVGSPVLISAPIGELNGDTGARADCTLRVNGAVVGAASRIWVDAGGTVSCSFLHTFSNAGTAVVEVSARNVAPADYDDANNAVTTTVNVTANELDMQRWAASSAETETRTRNVSEANWGFHSEYTSSGWTNSTYFSALWNDNLDIDTMKLRYIEKTDGFTLVDLPDVPLKRDDRAFSGHGAGQCKVSITSLVSAVICQRPEVKEFDFVRPRYVNPMIERRAGDVTYFFGNWGYESPDSNVYVYNVDTGRDVYGNPHRLGSAVSLDIAVSDAARTWAEHPSYTLQYTRTQDAAQPRQCYNAYWCREWSFHQFDRWGSETSPGY